MNPGKSVKDRVWGLLMSAMIADYHHKSRVYFSGEDLEIKPGGYVPNYYFVNIKICGSTEGKRELRHHQGATIRDEKESAGWIFEKKLIGHVWHWRILKKEVEVLKQSSPQPELTMIPNL